MHNTTRKTDVRMLLIPGLFSPAGTVTATTLTVWSAQLNSIGDTAMVDLVPDPAPTGALPAVRRGNPGGVGG